MWIIVQVRCVNKDVEEKIIKEIDKVKSEGDTLGGVVEIRVKNLNSRY